MKEKGKYILDDSSIPFATGINVVSVNDKYIIRFFNELPEFPEEFDLELNDNGLIKNTTDCPPKHKFSRKIVSSFEMDKKSFEEIVNFLYHNIIKQEDKKYD